MSFRGSFQKDLKEQLSIVVLFSFCKPTIAIDGLFWTSVVVAAESSLAPLPFSATFGGKFQPTKSRKLLRIFRWPRGCHYELRRSSTSWRLLLAKKSTTFKLHLEWRSCKIVAKQNSSFSAIKLLVFLCTSTQQTGWRGGGVMQGKLGNFPIDSGKCCCCRNQSNLNLIVMMMTMTLIL